MECWNVCFVFFTLTTVFPNCLPPALTSERINSSRHLLMLYSFCLTQDIENTEVPACTVDVGYQAMTHFRSGRAFISSSCRTFQNSGVQRCTVTCVSTLEIKIYLPVQSFTSLTLSLSSLYICSHWQIVSWFFSFVSFHTWLPHPGLIGATSPGLMAAGTINNS